jgi:hypothetical protein
LSPVSATFLFGLLFQPEDGGDVPPKRRTQSGVHGVRKQKPVLFIIILNALAPSINMGLKGFKFAK